MSTIAAYPTRTLERPEPPGGMPRSVPRSTSRAPGLASCTPRRRPPWPPARPPAPGTAGGTGSRAGCVRIGRLAVQDLLLDACRVSGTTDSSARVRVLRAPRICSVGPELDDAPEVHHRDAIGDVPREPEVVGDDEDRDAGLVDEPAHQLQDLAAHRRVEARHRLVGDEQARLEHHRARDHDTLPLPARHFVRVEADEPFGRPQPGASSAPRPRAASSSPPVRCTRSPSATAS